MSDKIRGALFNALGDIQGLRVLDVFSGSGAVAIEAISRGATEVIAIENDPQAQSCIHENRLNLGLTDLKIYSVSARTWLSTHSAESFDVIIADPPYDDPQFEIIEKLPQHVRPGGLLVVSWPAAVELPRLDEKQLVRDKLYGTARLLFYRH